MEDKESLSDNAYETIREAILNLEFHPGEHLSEARLAQRFGMSRTPVREAIRRLSRERLVRVEPKRGIYVAELDIKTARMRMLIVGALQGLAASVAANGLSDQDAEDLKNTVEELRQIAKTGGGESMMRVDDALHALIEKSVGNELLSDMIRVTRAPNERLRYLTLRDPEMISEIALLHADLGESVLRGEPDDARRLARQISQHSEKNLVDVLERWVVPLRERF